MGTPQYMSPESIRDPDHVDHRADVYGADIYALGAVGYYLLTGHQVFEANTIIQICSQHLSATPMSLAQRPGRPVPSDLEAIILACLATSPDERPQTALALQQRLLGCEDATQWTPHQAGEWWDEYGAALKTESEVSPMDSRFTIQVESARV
ncbi:MAG: serine/threonine protein kinase [Myxococcota bacterium]|jgi:serine/threonine protein kinase